MVRLSREAKIGLFLGVTLFILATFIFVIGDMSRLFRRPGYPLLTSFDSALGLEPHTVVRMAGVKIGYVKNIRLVKNKALITMDIFPSVAVPRGSKAALASLGLLGEKYIEVFPSTEVSAYEPGEELPSLPSVSFDQLGLLLVSIGDEIKAVSQSLQTLLGPKEKENISLTLENLASVSEELRHFLATSKPEIQDGVANFSRATTRISEEVKNLSARLQEVASSLEQFLEANQDEVKENLSRLGELTQQISRTSEALNRILERLEKGQGTAGRLLQDPELYEKTEEAVAQVAAVAEKVRAVSWNPALRMDYLFSPAQWRGQFSLALWPQGKEGNTLLSLGLVRDPRQEGFLWNLQAGAKIGRWAARAGLFESEWGVALGAEAVTKRLFFTLEGFAFNRSHGPKWRLYSRYQFSRNFYLILGVDDFGVTKQRSLILGFGAGNEY